MPTPDAPLQKMLVAFGDFEEAIVLNVIGDELRWIVLDAGDREVRSLAGWDEDWPLPGFPGMGLFVWEGYLLSFKDDDEDEPRWEIDGFRMKWRRATAADLA